MTMLGLLLVSGASSFTLPHVVAPLTSVRVVAPRMDFFGALKGGIAKLQAGSYDEAEVPPQTAPQA